MFGKRKQMNPFEGEFRFGFKGFGEYVDVCKDYENAISHGYPFNLIGELRDPINRWDELMFITLPLRIDCTDSVGG